jgi:hypothetical protein
MIPNKMMGMSNARKTCHLHLAIKKKRMKISRTKAISVKIGFAET